VSGDEAISAILEATSLLPTRMAFSKDMVVDIVLIFTEKMRSSAAKETLIEGFEISKPQE